MGSVLCSTITSGQYNTDIDFMKLFCGSAYQTVFFTSAFFFLISDIFATVSVMFYTLSWDVLSNLDSKTVLQLSVSYISVDHMMETSCPLLILCEHQHAAFSAVSHWPVPVPQFL